jgi:hypothetical protein
VLECLHAGLRRCFDAFPGGRPGRMSVLDMRCEQGALSDGCKAHSAIAPAGSNWSNLAAGVDTRCPCWPDGESRERLVVAKVEWRPDELFPRIGFTVTNLSRKPGSSVRFQDTVQGTGFTPTLGCICRRNQVTQAGNALDMERLAKAERDGLVQVACRPKEIPDLVMSPAEAISWCLTECSFLATDGHLPSDPPS